MVVTATQFKSSIGHYLDNIAKNDVYISKNGKVIAKLSHPTREPSILDSLVGIIPQNHISLEEARMERISRRAYPELKKAQNESSNRY